jgi:hypothetical protein
MRIVPFPGRGEVEPGDAWHIELDAALNGEGEGAAADSWRELRAGVRALAPAMPPEFEHGLRERLAAQGARGLRPAPSERAGASERGDASATPVPAASAGPANPSAESTRPPSPGRANGAPGRSRGRLGGLLTAGPRRAVAGAAIAGAVLAAVLVAGPLGAGNRPPGEALRQPRSAPSGPAVQAPAAASRAANGAVAQSAKGSSAGAAASVPAAGAEAGAPGRVQQRAATVSLSASASEVQTVADRVARLATSLGGFVRSSQVQVLAPREGTSHAELDLRLPSAKLAAALASLGELAPLRSESQSLQDITNAYDAARQRLRDATAERQALLRALARASTEGEIDSLRERLAQARRAITEAQAAFGALARRASASEVEVTVLGDAPAASEGLTLHRGLDDARRVLVATLAVLLIALAILVPVALLILALASARRAWRRQQRERALDAR